MIAAKLKTLPGLLWAAVLIAGALIIGWTAIKATTIELLPSLDVSAGPLIAGQPEFGLRMAMRDYALNKGQVAPRSLPAVRQAASQMPLDERPFLLVGSEDLRAGRNGQAVVALEAGRRLNPRQRWIHLLLLERYLRSDNYPRAADELAVLARLVGPAQSMIATALAQMSVAPETRDTVRRTLNQDPALEASVLASLAGADVEPSTIFAMASPAAFATATVPGGWGTTLVGRLIKNQDYRAALATWQRVNRIGGQRPLLYDAGLQGLPGRPPFNWTLESGSLGAVDLRGRALQVNYYGRDAGDLVSQLLVLSPGTYRFSQAITASQQTAASTLGWTIECANDPARKLVQMPLPLNAPAPRRVAATFSVPANCPAQLLHLTGSPGEFPAPITATIDHLQLERLGGQ